MCVTAKEGLERLSDDGGSHPVRMITYHSDEARQALKGCYREGRPEAAFLVKPDGTISSGLDAFLPLLPGLKGGRFLVVLFRMSWVRTLGNVVYRVIAKHRYRLFGEVTKGSS
ncbi:hypothetical protein W02_39910 [Nitrospira sp. KM1]|nr:hypothetical protein W02_39910 [Nitrospira sp. KM1]